MTPVSCCAVSVSGRCLRWNCVFTEPVLQSEFVDKMLSRFSFHFSRALCSVLDNLLPKMESDCCWIPCRTQRAVALWIISVSSAVVIRSCLPAFAKQLGIN